MGLKKRSLSPVGRGKPCNHRHKWRKLAACGTERPTKRGLGFFRHVTWQASRWCGGEAAECQRASKSSTQKDVGKSKQRVSRRSPANAFPIRSANVNLAKSQAFAGAQHGGCDDAVLAAEGFEEAGVHLHGGAGAEFAEVLHEGEHHGGVCGGHHGLAAEHAADAGELVALR
jgi:hypothetical protein